MNKLSTYIDKVSGETLYVRFNPDTGTTRYYKDKECKIKHRVDGPALDYGDGTEIYFQNDKHHRMDGPSITSTGIGSGKYWYVDGVEIDKDYLQRQLQNL